jgi:hypothetical protein
MTANEMQVGGRHYKSDYQHWDLAITIPLNYLEGCTTKHVTRWRKKLGMQDLRKAMHYLEKLIEVADYKLKRNLSKSEMSAEVNRFALGNNLSFMEEEYILALCTYENRLDLHNAHCILEEIIQEAEVIVTEEETTGGPGGPGTPEDGGHHGV